MDTIVIFNKTYKIVDDLLIDEEGNVSSFRVEENGNIISVKAMYRTWYIDNNGVKHIRKLKDDWQELECYYETPIYKNPFTGKWEIKNIGILLSEAKQEKLDELDSLFKEILKHKNDILDIQLHQISFETIPYMLVRKIPQLKVQDIIESIKYIGNGMDIDDVFDKLLADVRLIKTTYGGQIRYICEFKENGSEKTLVVTKNGFIISEDNYVSTEQLPENVEIIDIYPDLTNDISLDTYHEALFMYQTWHASFTSLKQITDYILLKNKIKQDILSLNDIEKVKKYDLNKTLGI